MTNPEGENQLPSVLTAGLKSRCPKCGQGKLYKGFLTLDNHCKQCGLDYSFADSADGPAVFIILIVGAILTTAIMIIELAYRPSLWLHAIIWPPLVLLLCLSPLRPLKALMIALQYRHNAREARSTKDKDQF